MKSQSLVHENTAFPNDEKEQIVSHFQPDIVKKIENILSEIYDVHSGKQNIDLSKYDSEFEVFSTLLNDSYNKLINKTILKKIKKVIIDFKTDILSRSKFLCDVTCASPSRTRRRSLPQKRNISVQNPNFIKRYNSLCYFHKSPLLKKQILNLLIELKKLHKFLNDSISDIEGIFQLPLKETDELTVYNNHLTNYIGIVLKDEVIGAIIDKYKNCYEYKKLIEEIESKFKVLRKNSFERQDIKPKSVDDWLKYIDDDDSEKKKKKKKKGKVKNSTNITSNNIKKGDSDFEELKKVFANQTLMSNQCQKIKYRFSKEWVRGLEIF